MAAVLALAFSVQPQLKVLDASTALPLEAAHAG
jgi:hypothetical protein